jgi:hypothetical protein
MDFGTLLTGVALAGSATAYLFSRGAERRDAFKDERRRIYTAFLVRQSELQDAYRLPDAAEPIGDLDAGDSDGSPDQPAAGQSHVADPARARAWEALAELRLLAPKNVENLALEYSKRMGRANPRRSRGYKAFPFAEAATMRDAFIEAAREDLVRRPKLRPRLVAWWRKRKSPTASV